ncbi:MAG TPA: methyltransferase domain-containing protein [Candidatus Acidoferrum sp.]|jgi:trans-aconitate 2-methyltransferase
MPAKNWDPSLYDAKHSFVSAKAKGLVQVLAARPGEQVLDLGCGTGTLTAEIASSGAEVLGVDRSAEMIAEARKKFPDLRFEVCDARSLPFAARFDAVFSNAALHWIPEAEPVVQGIARALRSGGRFVAEFGGKGNIQNLVMALESALSELQISAQGANPWFYPSIATYAAILEKHGLEVCEAVLFERPTELEDGDRGLATWITMFAASFLERVPKPRRLEFIQTTERLARATLWKTDHWELDYRRLRIFARKTPMLVAVRNPPQPVG